MPRPKPPSTRLLAPTSLAALGALLLVAPVARGTGTERARETLTAGSVFFISKSENKNQVHYGVRLDDRCAPAGDAPVFAYWRMLERGPLATEPLLAREVPAYGLASQHAQRNGSGGRVVMTLNALPKRPIVIDSTASAGGCAVTARAAIGGVSASLTSVFVQLRWPFGVDYMLLAGRANADGRPVHERIAP